MTADADEGLEQVLEAFVAEVVRLMATPDRGIAVSIVPADGWQAAAWLGADALALDVIPPFAQAWDMLDDYQLALLYGLGFEDAGPGDVPVLLRLEYDYEPGEEWEEQAIRELGLLAIGVLRDVLGEHDTASYRVQPRPPRRFT